MGSALWYSAPWLPTSPWWLVACGTSLMVAVLVVRLVRRQPASRYSLVTLLGIGVGLGIVLWRMTSALARNPALHLLTLQSGGVHLACFAGVMGLGAWYGRRWHGKGEDALRRHSRAKGEDAIRRRRRASEPTIVLGRWGVAAVAGYIGLCLVSQTVAQHLLARTLGPQMVTVERLTALPLPGWGPVQWRGIAVTPSSYLVSRVTLLPPTVTPPDIIAKGPDTSLVRTLRTSHLVRLFLNRARFPVVEVSARDGEQLVRYFDLRAMGDGRTRSRLDLVVRLNAAGHVQAIEFLNRVFPPTSPNL